jgi:response regulator RpfG family c-di-GMP phosphodiesterase
MIESDLVFAPEDSSPSQSSVLTPWKIMIVDDEPGIHDVTKLALKEVTFAGRALHFIDCYSGAQACEAIQANPDTALMLLDVVMENDHAGLDVARFIRHTAKNHHVRIVLRTGQPGQAPEREVITAFDINDYKEKTELTSSKLFTLIYSCLRAYRDISAIEASKKGLADVIEASANIFQLSSMDQFARGVLEQLAALVKARPGAVLLKSDQSTGALALSYREKKWHTVAATGSYSHSSDFQDTNHILHTKSALLEDVVQNKKSAFKDHTYVAYLEDKLGNINVLLLDGVESIEPFESDLIQLFMKNVSIAFENISLHLDQEETQREIVCLLGESVERRSQETGNHVRRVAAISELLAKAYGMNDEDAKVLKYASPLHDLGKIAIPDSILNKPGIHTPEERQVMQQHAEIGYRMLSSSTRKILRAAAVVAHEHHERWDGKGYPRGIAGENIHLYGRITAVADVFDALSNDRCYKKAWPQEKVLGLFKDEKGKQFDPQLVDVLFEQLDVITEIQLRYQDKNL